MKRLKILASAALVGTMAFCSLSASSYAEEHPNKEIQTLRDAAVALKSVNSDLSDRLSQYADKEANEKAEAEEKEEAEENKSADVKLLQDSAAALKASNPRLADEVAEYADKEAKEGEK